MSLPRNDVTRIAPVNLEMRQELGTCSSPLVAFDVGARTSDGDVPSSYVEPCRLDQNDLLHDR